MEALHAAALALVHRLVIGWKIFYIAFIVIIGKIDPIQVFSCALLVKMIGNDVWKRFLAWRSKLCTK